MQLTWKDIPVIPNSNEFLDVILNRTQRKTPTVVRQGFQISRIRAFYMRKVRYTADGFSEKLQEIVESFPKINEVHPFHRDLMDTLYEKNHYKVSLAALSRAKGLVEQVSRDYVRLLKFGQSLFQCKQLKKAALGRMATIMKKLNDPLLYLEQVRQHLSRLPSIDPNTRTLLICGYPNVGKSSFLRSVTRADVDVQPYAFTTKSLYVGHFDYKYLRFQAIDTPGILDRPTEEMNNIEMQSIYAIAHLRACVLYFMDLSEQCGFSIEDQVTLFKSIGPLFANKSVIVVMNKSDLIKLQDLPDERRLPVLEALQKGVGSGPVEVMELSCATEEGIMQVRNRACDVLLAQRIEQKLKSQNRIDSIMNKIHVSRPKNVDSNRIVVKPARGEELTPEEVLARDWKESRAMKLQEANGGAGVYQPDYKDAYLLEDDDWKQDVIPEILNGRNVYDFIDPDIASKLEALEQEEERLEKEGFYNTDSEEDEETAEYYNDLHDKAQWIRNKHKLMRNQARSKKTIKKKPIIPRRMLKRSVGQMQKEMDNMGIESNVQAQAKALLAQMPKPSGEVSGYSTITQGETPVDTRHVPGRDQPDRLSANTGSGKATAQRIRKLADRRMRNSARVGEADRHQDEKMPKHLYAGKRGAGKTQRR